MKTIAVVIIFMMSALIGSSGQAEIYSWTDENGVKHYSHTPPTEGTSPVKTATEIKSDPSAYAIQEVINETNLEAVIKQLDQSDPDAAPKAAPAKKPPSRKERVAAEAEKLEEKAKRNIEHEFKQAKLQLQAEIIEQALVEAEKKIIEKLGIYR